jgi:hypothetical protein
LNLPPWAVAPQYGAASLAGVLPGAIGALGVDLPPLPGDPEPVRAIATAPGKAVIVILVDGLGAANLAARAGHAPFLSTLPDGALTTCYPSTTVSALGCLGTGRPPGLSGLAGYALRDPWTERVTSLIGWETSTPPAVWQPHPTYFERLAAVGRPATFIGEARFEGSAMTASSLRGARFVGVKTARQRVETALRAAEAGGLVYLYWGELDKAAHAAGWQSPKWATRLEELDGATRQLARRAGPDVRIWLTADHGVVDHGPVWDVATSPELAAGVPLTAGEPRALHLYTDQPEVVAERWRELLGEAAWIGRQEEAVGLFGGLAERVRPMVGDVVVALAGNGLVLDSRTQKPGVVKMIGHHGSLTAAEMLIPLLQLG